MRESKQKRRRRKEEMMLGRKVCSCGICESVNCPSACATCVNSRLMEKYKSLKKLSQHCDTLRKRVDVLLKAKCDSNERLNWIVTHVDHITRLKERLNYSETVLQQGKAKIEEMQTDLDARSTSLAAASEQLARKQVEQLGQFYPDLVRTHLLGHRTVTAELYQNRRILVRQLGRIFILRCTPSSDRLERRGSSDGIQCWRLCGARLPIGTDPLSVPATELAASLGYMVQFLNLAAHYLSAPLLHNAGFAASSSRIWQRASYWDANPASLSEEYPLFVPRQSCGLVDEKIYSETGMSYVKFSDLENSGKPQMAGSTGDSSSYGSSFMSSEALQGVQKGLKLLKRSLSCLTAYGFSLLSSPVPSDMSTFEAYAELLNLFSAKEIHPRSGRSHTQSNSSVADSKLAYASATEENKHRGWKSGFEESLSSSSSFLYIRESPVKIGEVTKIDTNSVQTEKCGETVFDEWDMIEHATLPPPPSHSEDVEHWTRAMIIDATK